MADIRSGGSVLRSFPRKREPGAARAGSSGSPLSRRRAESDLFTWSSYDTAIPAGLEPGASPLAWALARPRAIALACTAILAAMGWLYLALMVAQALRDGSAVALGPAMGVFDLAAPAAFQPWVDALCAAPFALTGMGARAAVTAFAAMLAMWIAMVFAMMLPTAVPMLMTYAELTETAARQQEPAVSPLVLAAGYVTVWLGFALATAGLQFALGRAGLISDVMAPAAPWLAALIFVGAGLYQFSTLKQACLRICQRPFPFFFANWSERPRAIFRLGLRQGLYCLGCCWAAMLIMFAVGLMNVVWMAGLGIVMTIEKAGRGAWFSRVVGLALLAAGGALALSAGFAGQSN